MRYLAQIGASWPAKTEVAACSSSDGKSVGVFCGPVRDARTMNMAEKHIPASHVDLFKKKAFAHLATLMPNGQPQSTPVWVDYDGRYVLINTAEGRQKDKNLQRDGRVALSITDPDNPYRYLEVRGHVAERTRNGADAQIDALAKRYLGKDKYPFGQPGEVRVIYKVAPDHTTSTS
jgi:PPOX class probable F420-dependent enzyme